MSELQNQKKGSRKEKAVPEENKEKLVLIDKIRKKDVFYKNISLEFFTLKELKVILDRLHSF